MKIEYKNDDVVITTNKARIVISDYMLLEWSYRIISGYMSLYQVAAYVRIARIRG